MTSPICLKTLICINAFFAFLNYTMISPFIPPQGLELGLTNTTLSFIFSLSSLIGGISCYFAGMVCSILGRKNTIITGNIIQIVAIIYCAFLYYVTDLSIFVVSLSIIRTLQGLGDAFVTIGNFSLLATWFSKAEYQSAIALLNANVSIGIALGPMVGSAIVETCDGNYFVGLLIFAAVQSILVVISMVYIKENDMANSRVDDKLIKNPINGINVISVDLIKEREIESNNIVPSTAFVLKHEYLILLLISSFISIGIIMIPSPFLAHTMLKHYNSTGWMVGFYFLLLNFSEFVGSMVLVKFTHLNHNILVITGNLLMCLGMLIIGQPWCYLLPLEFSLIPIALGLILVGFGMILGFTIVVPAMIDYLQVKYKLTTDQKAKFGDICSGLFGIIFQEGGFVIPFLSGTMVDAVGFEKMCCISSLIPLLFAILFSYRCKAQDLQDQGNIATESQERIKKIDFETKNDHDKYEKNVKY